MTNKTTVTAEPNKQELFVIREFDAPREMVFRTFTEPDIFIKWWIPDEYYMVIDYMDYQSGGSYRYTFTVPNAGEMGFNGMVHEVAVAERIIQTAEMEGLPEKGHVCLETILFENVGAGRTKLIIQDVFQTVADRDMAVASGMGQGLEKVFERLDTILSSEQKIDNN